MSDKSTTIPPMQGNNRFGRLLKYYRENVSRPDGGYGYSQIEVGKLTVGIADRDGECDAISPSHISGVEAGQNRVNSRMIRTLIKLYKLDKDQVYNLMVGAGAGEAEDRPGDKQAVLKLPANTPIAVLAQLQKIATLAATAAIAEEKARAGAHAPAEAGAGAARQVAEPEQAPARAGRAYSKGLTSLMQEQDNEAAVKSSQPLNSQTSTDSARPQMRLKS